MDTSPKTVSLPSTLVVEQGETDAKVIILRNMPYVLGKLPHADTGFDNDYISRRHAEVFEVGGVFKVRDLGSNNDTSVNGIRIGAEGQVLRKGDRIELAEGQVILRFETSAPYMIARNPYPAISPRSQKMVGFQDAVKLGFQGYFNFTDEATRAEYWWWHLFHFGVVFLVSLAEVYFLGATVGLAFLIAAFLFIPLLAVRARWLHNIGMSGWWQLLMLVPLLGLIFVIWAGVKEDDSGRAQ